MSVVCSSLYMFIWLVLDGQLLLVRFISIDSIIPLLLFVQIILQSFLLILTLLHILIKCYVAIHISQLTNMFLLYIT